ncbi:MAG: trigger factor [Faecalibacterium sp.]
MKMTQGSSTTPGVYQWDLTATAAEFEAAVESSYQANKASLTLEGYAAGEVPRDAIEAKEGEGYFYYEAINRLLSQGADTLLAEAIETAGITPLTAPDYNVAQCGKEGFCMQITVGILPDVTLEQYTGFTLTYPPMPLGEEAVEQQLQHIQQQIAKQKGADAPLPPLDDAFAQAVSDCATLAELREKIAASLAAFARGHARKQAQFMLLEKVGQNCTTDLPEYLLKKEYDLAMEALAMHLQQHGVPFETYLAEQGKTKEDFEAENHQSAIAALRAKLAAYTIAQKEGITASEMEIEGELVRLAAQYQQSVQQFKAEHPSYLVKNDVILNRTIAFLEQHSTLIEGE